MSSLRSQVVRSTASSATFVPRVATYSTASYSSACHQQEEEAPASNDKGHKQNDTEGRSTKPKPVVSSDEEIVSTGGHVKI